MADELQRLRAALQDPPPPAPCVRRPVQATRVCAVVLLALGAMFALQQQRSYPRRAAAYDDDPLFQPF